jgi:hypothetical protein
VSKSACAALLALAVTASAQAQTTIASDNAANYGTSGNWTNGSNRGTGFGAWVISNGGNATNILGDPADAGITGMNATSFRYGGTSGYSDVGRTFTALQVGDTFSFQWGNNWDTNSAGNKGVNIYTGGFSGNQVVNINMASSANITINGQPMFNNYGTAAISLNFEYVATNSLRVFATGRDGAETFDQTFSVAGSPDAFKLYAGDLNADSPNRFPYANNFTITSTAPPTISGSNYTVGATGLSYNYQISASPSVTSYNATGLPAGLSINSTTGLISGTPSATGTSSVSITATNASGTSSPFSLTIAIGTGADTAANYGSGWSSGLNGGTGFGNWTLTSNNGTGAAGSFIGDPSSAGISGMPSSSFGLYANPILVGNSTSGAFVDAIRPLASALSVNQSLSFQWSINFDSGSAASNNVTYTGNKGFVLSSAAGEEIVVSNGGSGNITVLSKTSNATTDTGFTYGTNAMLWTFTQTTNSSVTLTATPRASGGTTYTTSLSTNGSINSIKFYASGMEAGEFTNQRQPYFNNFLITGGSTPEPPAYDSWASSYGLNATVTTGPTAGAPTADPDADSFTNQQEYAFGTNPTQATAGLLTSSSGASGLTVVFLTRSNLTYNVQTTDNLSTIAFSNNGTVTGSVSTSDNQDGVPSGYTRKQFTIVPSGSKNFYRVVASEQAPG